MTAPVPILMYHAVGHRPAEAAYGLSVAPDAFAEQLRLLGERGFTRSPPRSSASPGGRADAVPCRAGPC